MMDVPWSWWVTSVVALAVVIVCTIVFWRTRGPVVRGVLATLAVQGVLIAALAPAVMDDSSSNGAMMGMPSQPATTQPAETATKKGLPFTFFLTHYEMLGDPNEPSGVRYSSNGRPFAKAPGGSTVTLSGSGGWDPASRRVAGGGRYTITEPGGAVTSRGRWTVTKFVSFSQLPGWWGIEGFEEQRWQGPPGSASFSGFLRLRVTLQGQGQGLLTAWCLMPDVPKPADHQGDGISLTGATFDFTGYRESELSAEGVMFYGPGTRR